MQKTLIDINSNNIILVYIIIEISAFHYSRLNYFYLTQIYESLKLYLTLSISPIIFVKYIIKKGLEYAKSIIVQNRRLYTIPTRLLKSH